MLVEHPHHGETCMAGVWAEGRPGIEVPCGQPAIVRFTIFGQCFESLCLEHARNVCDVLSEFVRVATGRQDPINLGTPPG